MKIPALLSVLSCFLLSACDPGEAPKHLQGEEDAVGIVRSFLKAVELGDFDKAEEFLYDNPDYLLKDLEKFRDLFFAFTPTDTEIMSVGKENYGREWHIKVEMKFNYGDKMKQVRFTLKSGSPPKLRGLVPILP